MTIPRVIKIVLCGSLFCLVQSCSYPVVELPETTDKIIVQSEFTHGHDILIYVSKGVGFPSPEVLPYVPDSIELHVISGTNNLEVIKHPGEAPFYQVRAETKPGQEFTLSITMPYEEVSKVEAKTYIPEPSILKVYSIEQIRDTLGPSGPEIEVLMDFEIGQQNQDKYYELLISKQKTGQVMSPLDTIWRVLSGAESRIVVAGSKLPPGIRWLSERQSFLIDYYSLENKRIQLYYRFQMLTFEEISELVMQLKTHTADGFNFIKSYDKTSISYPTDFPILDSNIRDGIGIFTGYGSSETTYKLVHKQ